MHSRNILFLCVIGLYRLTGLGVDAVSVPQLEIDALKAVYDAAGGEFWDWHEYMDLGVPWIFEVLNQRDPCADNTTGNLTTWQGITCTNNPYNCSLGATCNIEFLLLGHYNLTGIISPQVADLRYLTFLSLSFNRLGGSIPSSIGALSGLRRLGLRANSLTGNIPTSIGSLSQLALFDLSGNSIEAVPPEICKMSELKLLSLEYNSIYSSIPRDIGNLSKLEFLNFGNNFMYGDIPESIGKLQNLIYIYLHVNAFVGSLPTSIGSLASLKSLDFDRTHIDGHIPTAIGQLSSLEIFSGHNTLMSGPLPSQLGLLTKMSYFYVQENRHTGRIPPELFDVTGLTVFDTAVNHFTGTLPSSFGRLSSLTQMKVYQNHFTGELPAGISLMTNITNIQVQGNYFKGDLSSIFSPEIQSELFVVDISDNTFSGSLPKSLFFLPKILVIAASSNCFSGELPDECNVNTTMLAVAMDGLGANSKCDNAHDLGYLNPMYGSLSSCYFENPYLISFYSASNGLYGTLPEISNISVLSDIDLSRNHLSGSLPHSFLDRRFKRLSLNHNRLTSTLTSYSDQTGFHFTLADSGSKTLDALMNSFLMSLQSYLTGQSEVDITVNRFSGDIPAGFNSVSTLSMLLNNLFSCSKRSELPNNDPNYERTVCGSDDLDSILFALLGITCVVSITVGLLYYYAEQKKSTYGHLVYSRFHKAISIPSVLALSAEESDFSYFILLLCQLTQLCITLTGFIVLVCIPIYCILKAVNDGETYRTHSVQLGWLATGAMITGVVPAVLMFFAWCAVAALCCWGLIRASKIKMDDNIARSTQKSMDTRRSTDIAMTLGSLHDSFFNEDVLPEGHSRRLDVLFCCFLLVNVLFSLALNSSYVYISLSDEVYLTSAAVSVIQLSVAIIRGIWGRVIVMLMHHSAFGLMSVHMKSLMLSSAFVLNDVMAPTLAFLFTDASCFLDMIVPAETKTTSYYFAECSVYYGLTCVELAPLPFTAESRSFFTYNFQCGSSLISAFVPVLLYSCAVSILMSFAMQCVFYFELWIVVDLFPKFLINLTPLKEMLKRRNLAAGLVNSSGDKVGKIFNAPLYIALLVKNLAVLCTFGFTAPYLAIATALSAIMIQYRLFSHISFLFDMKDTNTLVIVPLETATIGTSKLCMDHVFLIVAPIAAVFIGCVLADIAGDEHLTLWRIPFAFLGAAVLFVILLYLYFQQVKSTNAAGFKARPTTVEMK